MAYEIYGPFHRKEDAIKTADILGLKGFKSDSIFVFANEQNTNDLRNQMAAHLENTYTEQHKDHSFINKLKNMFLNQSNAPKERKERLRDLGLSNKQIERYLPRIDSGDILIVVNNDKRIGNFPTDGTTALSISMPTRNKTIYNPDNK